MNVVASAPGKIVVSGEYAVLAGAPALVAAVARRTVCTLRSATSGDWRFTAHGAAADVAHPLADLVADRDLPRSDAARLCAYVLRHLDVVGASAADLPRHLTVDIDSRAGFAAGVKLGIGTSAAVCAALSAALLTLVGCTADPFPLAYAAHRAAQGGRGSGVDVAAVCRGGWVRYTVRGPSAVRVARPPVAFAAIATGVAADTGRHIASFDEWRAGTTPPVLAALVDASARVADAITDAAAFVRELRAYATALRALDDTAGLGIYSAAHRALAALAERHAVVYKPCGAGGGDLGAAFAIDRTAVDSFVVAAREHGFAPLDLEWDEHGITVGQR